MSFVTRLALRIDGRLIHERMTYQVAGRVEVDGERLTLSRERAAFFRNHSWSFLPGR